MAGRDDERVLLEDDDDVYVWMMKASSRCIHTCTYTHAGSPVTLPRSHSLTHFHFTQLELSGE